MISVENVTVSFDTKTVLEDISFTAKAGEVIGLIAPNGTGKTTLINVLMNYLTPTSGKVTFGPTRLAYTSAKNETKIHQKITNMPDQSDLYNHLTGYDHLILYHNMWPQTALPVGNVIEDLQMSAYVKQKVGEYSLGMRQRLCFAMQIVANTDYMLMDEAMNGLDPTNVALITNIILQKKQAGKIILIASHLLDNLATFTDKVLFLKAGKIVHQLNLHEVRPQYIKFSQVELPALPHLPLLQSLPNHTHYFPKQSNYLADLAYLEAAGIKEITIGPLDLADLFSYYYEGT